MKLPAPTDRSDEQGISGRQMALLSGAVFDIPPRTRRLIALAATAGIVVVVVASLQGGQDHTIEMDKVLHFSGYAILASLFVLALRPVLYVPALLALVGMGVLIECIQPFTGRSMEFMDGVANTAGVAIGASVALLVRAVYSYIRRELSTVGVRQNLVRFPTRGLILREGGRVRSLYVIKDGLVRLSKKVGDDVVELGYAEPGDVLGTVGVLLDAPQFATIEAVSPTTLYRMELMELMDSAGGREQPVCTVLRSLAEGLRYTANRMANSEAQRDSLALAIEAHGDPTGDAEDAGAQSPDVR